MDSGYNLLKEIMFFKKIYIKKQHICTILIFQYVSKAVFLKKNIKVTFLILNDFPVVLSLFGSPVVVFPLCLPVVPPRFGVEVLGPVFRVFRRPKDSISNIFFLITRWVISKTLCYFFYILHCFYRGVKPGILSRALWSQTSWILSQILA